jgi:hypothetical protein
MAWVRSFAPSFFHSVLEMNLHGFFGDEKSLCEVAIPISLCDVAQNINFASCEQIIAQVFSKLSRDLRQNALLFCERSLKYDSGRPLY